MHFIRRKNSAAGTLIGNWIGRHRFMAAYLIAVLSWIPILFSFDDHRPQGDISIYQNDANSLIQGQMPYRDTLVEYPPYAIPIFLLPRVFGKDNYLDSFRIIAALCDFLLRFGLVMLALRNAKSSRSLLPLCYYCAAVPFIHYFFLQRFDLWPAVICMGALLLFCAHKPGWSGFAIAIGIGIKIYPAIFVPPLFILALRQHEARRFSVGLAAGLAPILMLSFVLPWWRFAQFQGDRGLQCESLAASLIWCSKLLGMTNAHWVSVKRWSEVQGPWASAILPWARGLFIFTVSISVTIACSTLNRCRDIRIGFLARVLLLPLLGFVAFNQVLSPQFMIWLLPLAAMATLEGNPLTLIGIPLATMLTPVFFPSLNGDYGVGLDFFETSVLVERNLILVVVWWWLLLDQWTLLRSSLKENIA